MCSHCIFGISPKGFHDDVLLYPFEENFNVPSVPVQAGYFQCADFKVVCDENDFIIADFITAANSPYRLGIQPLRLGRGQTDCEVPKDIVLAGEVLSVTNDLVAHVVLWSAHPIGSSLVKAEQGLEINIRFVHDVEGTWLWREAVKFIAVVPPPVRYVDVGRDAPAQVKQCVHLYSTFAVLALSPCRQFYAG